MQIKLSSRKILVVFLKAVVFAVTLWYLYEKVIKSKELSDLSPLFQTLEAKSLLLLFLVFLMMFLNWGIETYKWRLLIGKFEQMSFSQAFKAVWSGITINNWVPNRMAEFAGRILYLKKEHQAKAVASTFVGSFAQMTSTLLFGLPAVVIHFQLQQKLFWMFLFAVMIIIALILFFKIPQLQTLLKKIKILKWLSKHTQIVEAYTLPELWRILALSLVRYSVYIFQYALLLRIFQIDLPLIFILTSVSSVFLIQTFLPATTLTELGIRGAVIIFVFKNISVPILSLIAAAYTLWLINIIIPTIFGMFFIVSIKKKKEAAL